MKSFRLTREAGSMNKGTKGILIAIPVLAVLLSVCAFPIPAYLKEARWMSHLKDLKEQRRNLFQVQKEIAAIQRNEPEHMERLIPQVNASLPRVDNLLTLRDLLLAQADLCGVEVKQCSLSLPSHMGLEVPNRDGPALLGRVYMEVRGQATLEKLLLLVGFLESTELVYKVIRLNVAFGNLDHDQAQFSLDLVVRFRGDQDWLASHPPEDHERCDLVESTPCIRTSR